MLAHPSINDITVWVQTGLHNLLEEGCLEFSRQFGIGAGEGRYSSRHREKG